MGDAEAILDLPPPPADHRLAWGEGPLQFGELRLPAGPGPHPLAVAIHGGFWRARYDLAHLGHLCAAIAGAGVATFNLEYRRVGDPGGGFPGTLDDVARGLAFARGLAERFPIDPARIAVLGHSAGGHLALWGAARARVPLRGVVALAAVSDLAEAAALRLGDGAVDAFLGGAPEELSERLAAASPRALLPLGVRQVLLHGERDDTVPFSLSQRYAAAARTAGDPVELLSFPDAGHFEPIDPETEPGRAAVRAVRALLSPAQGV